METLAGTTDESVKKLLGDPRKAILSMTIPILISIIIGQINMFVDTIWCSSLGIDALSAISLTSSLYFLIVGIGNGIGIGASVSISRCIGADDKKGADSRARQILVIMAIISLALIPVLLVLMRPIISIIGGEEIMEECVRYITPMFLLCPITIINGVVAGILRAEGAAKKSMIVSASSAVVNMILDPILIFGFDLGLEGASTATMLSGVVSIAIGFGWYLRKKTYVCLNFKNFSFVKKELLDIFHVGIPQMVELNIMSFFNLILVMFVVSCGGTEGLAVYNTPWRIVMLAMVPASAIASAMIPVCSAALGQNDVFKARTGFYFSTKAALIFGISIAVTIAVLANYCVLLFTYEPGMEIYRDEIVKVIRIYAIFMPCYGLISIGSSMLQALRKSQYSLVSALLRNVLLIGIYAYTSTISMDAIYWGLVIGEIIGGVMMMGIALSEFRKKEKTCCIALQKIPN